MKIALICLLCSLYLVSQAQIRLGIQTGITSATFAATKPLMDPVEPVHCSYTTNFEGGIKAEFTLKNFLFLQSGLIMTSKGSHIYRSRLLEGEYETENIFLSYIQLPADIIYKLPLSKKINAFAGAGAYASYGIWCTETGKGTLSNGTFIISNYVVFDTYGQPRQVSPLTITPFDYGYSGVVGIDVCRFQITGKYTLGQVKLMNAAPYQSNYRNRAFSFSACYYFK